MSELTKVAAYVRFSSDNQRDESIDAQIRAIEEYAKRNKCQVVSVYQDKAKSATTDKRPGFQKMITESKLGLFKAVIVHKLDRFSRDKFDAIFYKRELKKLGIRVISVLENLDDSPESIMMESMLEGMAQYFSANLSREVMKGLMENALSCRHTGGKPPLGYDVTEDRTYIINEAEAATVKLIFSMYLDDKGYDTIISELLSKGYRTKLGGAFTKGSIHDILRNEKYKGVYTFNRAVSKDPFGKRNNHMSKSDDEIVRIEGGMPEIISPEDFAKVQAKMNANKHTKARYRANELYLLSGLIQCGECNGNMAGSVKHCGRNKLKYVTYKCNKRDNSKTCKNKDIRREYIEEYILSELEKEIFNDDTIPYLAEKLNEHNEALNVSRKEELAVLNRQLDNIKREQTNIVNAIAQGFAQPIFKTKLNDLQDQSDAIEAELISLQLKQNTNIITGEAISKILSLYKVYVKNRDIPECKKFIAQYVEKVIVYENSVKVIFKLDAVVLTCGGGEGQPSECTHRYTSVGTLCKA